MLSTEAVVKALGTQTQHLAEEKDMLSAERESFRVAKQEKIGHAMSLLRQRRYAKATKKLREHIE